MERPSKISEHKDSKLVDILLIQGISECRCDVCIPIPVETFPFSSPRIHLAVTCTTLFIFIKHLKSAYII